MYSYVNVHYRTILYLDLDAYTDSRGK